jgi:hypothetical protein
LVVILGATMTFAASAQGPINGEPDNPVPQAASAPGTTTVVKEVEVLAEPAAPNALWFKFYTANTFVPYDDNMTYSYYGAGCTYRTGGTAFTEHDLQLPQGAVIDYLRIYYYDNDAANNAAAFLFAYDGAGNYTQLASVASTGVPGQSDTGSGFFSHPVDNVSEGLSIRLSFGNATTSNLRICGVRLRYQYTIATTSLPLILNRTVD